MTKFTKNLEIGIPIIDSQHKILLDKINKIYETKTSSSGSHGIFYSLTIIIDHCKEHFKSEEDLMISSNYPHYLSHKECHEAFSRRCEKVLEEYQSSPKTVNALIKVNDFIVQEMIDHFQVEDAQFAEHYKNFIK